MNETWQQALTIIRREIQPVSFDKWFGPDCVSQAEKRGEFVYVCVPDRFVKHSYTAIYGELIQSTLSAILQQEVQLMVVDTSSEKIPDDEHSCCAGGGAGNGRGQGNFGRDTPA